MTNQDIKELVASILLDSKTGTEIERPKIECKRQWYDLKAEPGISEFIKDTSAMANTVGLDGFIIIGYDAKTKELVNVQFTDSKLRDVTELYGLLMRHLSEPFTLELHSFRIEGFNIDVLHIPPSLNKPHVIKSHKTYTKDNQVKMQEENRILIRKTTGIYPATKYDLELMYYDRKNIIPEYEVYATIEVNTMILGSPSSHLHPKPKELGEILFLFFITLENTGRRPIIIKEMDFEIAVGEQLILSFAGSQIAGNINHITLQPGQISSNKWEFQSMQYSNLPFELGQVHLNAFRNDFIKIRYPKFHLIASTGKIIQPILRVS